MNNSGLALFNTLIIPALVVALTLGIVNLEANPYNACSCFAVALIASVWLAYRIMTQ